jgi:hypothetical protein
MTDDIVAAHLAAALIQAVVRNSTPKLPPLFISIAWRLVRVETKAV